MLSRNFTFKSEEGTEIFGYKWMPEETNRVKGIVQIVHGMAETRARYEKRLSQNRNIISMERQPLSV
ncbi:alpha/beta hydrolase [Desulfosporosinus sp. SB140]|uniref:alpha/beta hydrolase n=1 Tax=Desulfosporosinus paludis TaxID=3115649 RepID=UPI003890CA86